MIQGGRKNKVMGRTIVVLVALSMVMSGASFVFFSQKVTSGNIEDNEISAKAPSTMIRLSRGVFDTSVSEPILAANLKVDAYPSWFTYYIVQHSGPVSEDWKAELIGAGAEIVSYIPDNAFLVRIPRPNIEMMKGVDGVQWSGLFQPGYKIDPALDDKVGTVTLEISFFVSGTNGPTVRYLRDNGAEFLDIVRNRCVNFLRVRTDASLIDEIANFPDVHWITEWSQPVAYNAAATQLMQSGSESGSRVITDIRGIYGNLATDNYPYNTERMVAAVCDSGIRVTHEVWSEPGKIIANYVPVGSSGAVGIWGDGEHGQATASIVCGDAPPWCAYNGNDGHAFGARLVFQDIDPNTGGYVYPPPDYYNHMFKDAQFGGVDNFGAPVQGGATVHSNSWGGDGTYSDENVMMDQYVWDHKDFVICFVPGSDINPFVNRQSRSKNIMAPSRTTENGASVTGSAGGPCADGRIKPDLAVVGTGITTADSGSDTDYWPDNFAGTSASTPALAGCSLLVQQYFVDGWCPTGTQVTDNGFMPSAALVKAVMINSAVDLGTANIPNMVEGWGRPVLENGLYFNGDSRAVRYIDYGLNMTGTTHGSGLVTDDLITYDFGVNDTSQPFRVSLVWSDYPADPVVAQTKALVNDIDLIVTDPGGTSYTGNNFQSGWSVDTGVSSNIDQTNNIECVYIQTPSSTGVYTIEIEAGNIPVGPQDFALVISGGLSEGYGTVTIDRNSYTRDDQINIKVEDTNDPAGTVDVTVVSNLGDSEAVTLNSIGPGSGVFTGSIMTEFGVITAEDGILGVEDGGTITVTYSDPDPVHDSTATGRIEYAGPVITNVRAEDITGTSAVIKWDTDISSNSTVYYGTSSDEATWTDVQGDNVFTATHSLSLTGLTMDTLYYFDVASSTIRGTTSRDDYGGDHYTFSTIGPATGALVLLVDDDDGTVSPLDGTPYNEDWENMLTAYGWTYTRWDYKAMGGPPTQADMEQCKMVMWICEEGYPQIGASDRAELELYLQNSPDPKWYPIGQDIGWDMNWLEPSAWYEQYFHAIYRADDASGGSVSPTFEGDINVIGLVGDPISDGYELGGTPGEQFLYVDVFNPDGNPGPTSSARFWPDDLSNNGGTITWDYSPASYDDHSGGGDCAGVRADEAQTTAHAGYPYRMVYEGFTHEMMGTWNPPVIDPVRSDIMDKSLIWLYGGDHPEVTLTYPIGGETLSGTETITWTSVGANNIKVFYSANNGQAWHLLYEDITGTATSYNWDTTSLDDGTDYKVKVLVTSTMNLTDFKTSGAFSISNGVDNTGPMVVGGSVKISPQPTYTPATATLTATITDFGRGDSNIAAAEYFINTIGADGSGTTMNAVLPPFNDLTEDVTASVSSALSNGDHIIYVHGQDAVGNWGSCQSVIWHVVNLNPLPVVTVTYPTAVDIVERGTFDIAWDATDIGTADEDLWIDIYYSVDSGSTWIPIDSGLFNTPVGSGTYSWATVSDGVNYLIRVNATDDDPIIPLIGTDDSDNTFSIDNTYYNPPVYPDRWHFQVQASGPNQDLDMKPVETSIQEIAIPIDSAGEHLIGTWETTDVMTEDTDITGQWTFSAWGKVDIPGLCSGYMRARIYASSDLVTPLYVSTDTVDIGTNTAYTEYWWQDPGVTGFVPIGDTIIVELYVNALSGTGMQYVYDYPDADLPVDGTVVNDWTYLDDTTPNSYEQIEEVQGSNSGTIFHETFPTEVLIWDGTGQDEAWNVIATGEPGDIDINSLATGSPPGGASPELSMEDCDGAWGADDIVWASVNLSAYTNVQLSYYWQQDNTDIGEGFRSAYSTDATGGTDADGNWTLMYEWLNPAENIWTQDVYYIPDFDCVSNFKFRFNAHATLSGEEIFIDEVVITGDEVLGQLLEHKWTIDVTGSATEVLYAVEAYVTPGEAMEFYYSTNGLGTVGDANWNYMLDVTKLADDDTLQLFTLPVATSGTIYIGVIDLDQTAGDSTTDTIYIDQMFIRSVTGPGPSFTFGYDYGDTQSSVQPSISYGGSTFDVDLTGTPPNSWVFMSFPLDTSGHPLDVLNDSPGTGGDGMTEWDIVRSYVNGEWLTYAKFKPPQLNTLTYLDNHMGFWMHINVNDGDQMYTFTGPYSTGETILLDIGWNMVGYPSMIPRLASETLPPEVDMIAIWDPAQPYQILDITDLSSVTMSPGNGYWVRATAACTWPLDGGGPSPQPVMTVTKTGPATANTGEIITYWINYTNTGDDWAYNVTITETYPVGVTFISAVPAPTIGNNIWSIGAVAPGGSGAIQITMQVNVAATGILTNWVSLDYENATGVPQPTENASADTMIIFPQMVITKTAPATANPGETIIYTITYNNIGTDSAYNVMITENYSPDVTFVNASPPPDFGNNVWFIGNVPPGAGGTIYINVSVNLAAVGVLTNWVYLDYENAGGMTMPQESAFTNTTIINPSMVISKEAPATANTGEVITYWINYSNTGDDWAYNVVITEAYPFGVTFISSTPAPDVGNNVWLIGAVPPGGSGSIEITVQVETWASGWLNNTVTLDYENEAGIPQLQINATAITLVVDPLMVITKTAPATANPGESILYTITYQNIGTDTAHNIVITETYPPWVTFINANPPPDVGNNVWLIGDFAPGAGGTIYINVTVNAGASGTLTNWVFLDYEDSNGEAQSQVWDSADTLITDPFMVVTKDAPPTANTGEMITYFINYTNIGTDWAYNVVITDTYPVGVTFIAAIPPPDIGDNIWLIGAIAPGASGSIQITVQVNLGVPIGTVLVNNVTLDYGSAAGVPYQTWAEASTLVVGPLMSVSKWAPASASPGDFITYWIFYNNTGSDWAYNVVITESYPPNTTFVSAIPPPDVPNNIWLIGDVAPGAGGSIEITMQVDPTATGNLTNWVYLDYENAVMPMPQVSDYADTIITSGDTDPPDHSNEFPAIDGYTNDATPLISVHVTDISGVNSSTIRLYIEGFSVFYTLDPITNGYNVTYQHGAPFSDGQVITCQIVAGDMFGNTLDFTWYFTVDLTAPWVTFVDPFDGEVNVSLDHYITVAFSEPMDTYWTELAFSISPFVNGSIMWMNGTDAFIYDTLEDYQYNTTYTVTISILARDVAGNTLLADYTWNFTTEDTDTTPPEHSNESPPPGGNTSDDTPTISVHVTDISGVNASTIRLYVQGFAVFYTLDPITNGFNVSYTHEAGFFDGEVVTCRIVAEDIYGNELDFTWSFTVIL